MIYVTYKGHKYYITEEIDLKKEVFDNKMNKIGLVQAKKIGFEDLDQMWYYLNLIHNKTRTLKTLDQSRICDILSENLQSQGYSLNPSFFKPLLKGINYSIIKPNDKNAILKIIQSIKDANKLEFQKIKYESSKVLNKNNLKKEFQKYLTMPYGRLEKTSFETIPLFYEDLIEALTS